MPVSEKVRILIAVASGLEYAHGAGIVHRDIKPSNIRILDNGAVKIMDFGIAKSLDATTSITKDGTAVGSTGYMSPEQIVGEAVDSRTDLFSFGVVAYELLSLQKPFHHDKLFLLLEKIVKEEPEPLAEAAPDIPASLVAIVEHAMRKEPAERFSSAGELKAALEAARDALRDVPSRAADGPEARETARLRAIRQVRHPRHRARAGVRRPHPARLCRLRRAPGSARLRGPRPALVQIECRFPGARGPARGIRRRANDQRIRRDSRAGRCARPPLCRGSVAPALAGRALLRGRPAYDRRRARRGSALRHGPGTEGPDTRADRVAARPLAPGRGATRAAAPAAGAFRPPDRREDAVRPPLGSILVVDDDARVREAVRVLLEGEGFAVATAADGAEAIGRLEAGDVSLVLLDLAMPGVDGWQFLTRREKEAGLSRAPVVLLSGLPFVPDAPGVADFIRKPIDSRKLIDCVHRFCGKPAGP